MKLRMNIPNLLKFIFAHDLALEEETSGLFQEEASGLSQEDGSG